MEAKLEELTKKIYEEGVQKGQSQADEIISKAKAEADAIIKNAKQQYDQIISDAKKEQSKMVAKGASEIRMAGEQAVTSLKQEISSILSNFIVSSGIKNALSDNEFVKNLIKTMVEKWNPNTKTIDAVLTLPGNDNSEFTNFFKAQASDLLTKGLEIKFEERMDGGFKIGPKDKSFIVSFTDKDFHGFFQSFLKPMTKEILFKGE